MSIDKTNDLLNRLGWDNSFEEHFAPFGARGMVAGRIYREDRNLYWVESAVGSVRAEVSGRFRNQAGSRADFPAVGDWVAMDVRTQEERGVIQTVLPRKSCFSRKAVLSGGMPDTGGKADEQVLAANVDTVFLVSGLDGNFNLRRIERYLTVAYNSGAVPVIILNKADLCADVEAVISRIEMIAVGVPAIPISAVTGDGVEAFGEYLTAGRTVAFLGSSGVGKSTLINFLLGEERLKTNAVREHDSRGRHTTTHRELIVLPGGGIVIDTPGMREMGLWADDDGLSQVFEDVEYFVTQCRFHDCAHNNEPGCAVREAIENGQLDAARFESYRKLQKEIQNLAIRKNKQLARHDQRTRDKRMRQYFKDLKKVNKKYQ